MIIIYLDENLSRYLAYALNELQKPLNKKYTNLPEAIEVRYLPDDFGKGANDEDWIPKLNEGNCVITADINIRFTKHQRELFEHYQIGMFFLKTPKGYDYWATTLLIIKKWVQVLDTMNKKKPPFAYRIKPNSKKLEDIS